MALVAVSGGEAPDAKRARTTPARVEAPLELRRALEKLPPLALVPNVFCTYTKPVMQRVPVWKELLPYMVTLKIIMELTGGHNIVQTQLRDVVMNWAADMKLSYTRKQLLAGAYNLRCMISHLLYAKKTKKELPKEQRKLQPLYDLVAIDPCQADEDEDEDSSSSSGDAGLDEVLQSEDPTLNALLNPLEHQDVEKTRICTENMGVRN